MRTLVLAAVATAATAAAVAPASAQRHPGDGASTEARAALNGPCFRGSVTMSRADPAVEPGNVRLPAGVGQALTEEEIVTCVP